MPLRRRVCEISRVRLRQKDAARSLGRILCKDIPLFSSDSLGRSSLLHSHKQITGTNPVRKHYNFESMFGTSGCGCRIAGSPRTQAPGLPTRPCRRRDSTPHSDATSGPKACRRNCGERRLWSFGQHGQPNVDDLDAQAPDPAAATKRRGRRVCDARRQSATQPDTERSKQTRGT